jgi:hypothetical protein
MKSGAAWNSTISLVLYPLDGYRGTILARIDWLIKPVTDQAVEPSH